MDILKECRDDVGEILGLISSVRTHTGIGGQTPISGVHSLRENYN
jgi:hypothetical protein